MAGPDFDVGSRRLQSVAGVERGIESRRNSQRGLRRSYCPADESGANARQRHGHRDFGTAHWLVLAVADFVGGNSRFQHWIVIASAPQ